MRLISNATLSHTKIRISAPLRSSFDLKTLSFFDLRTTRSLAYLGEKLEFFSLSHTMIYLKCFSQTDYNIVNETKDFKCRLNLQLTTV